MMEPNEKWWAPTRFSAAYQAFVHRPRQQCLVLLLAFGLPLLGLPFALASGGTERWERVAGLAVSGQVRQILCASTDDHPVVYVVVGHWGVFVSKDGGLTWEAINRRLPRGEWGRIAIGPLALAPDDPQFLVAGISRQVAAGRPVLYKTHTGGQAWVPRRGLGTQDIEALTIAPGNRVYAASSDHLYLSIDGGDTWLEVGSPSVGAILTMVLEQTTGALYLGTEGDGLWLTMDQGNTWKIALPDTTVQAVVAVGPERVYAGTDDGVYCSSDSGNSWRLLLSSSGLGPVTALAACPGSPDRLFAVLAGRLIRYSEDGGMTWRQLQQALLDVPVTALAVDPQSAQTLYVGTRRGLWRCILEG